jgi:hypothetical protein
MPTTLPLRDMSIEEKLQTMEALWDDLCKNADTLKSPSWHHDILKERERMLDSGEDEFVDWNRAKKNIRDAVS